MALWALRFFNEATALTPSRVLYAHAGSDAEAAVIAGRVMFDGEQTVEVSRVVYRKNLQLPPGVLVNPEAAGKNSFFST